MTTLTLAGMAPLALGTGRRAALDCHRRDRRPKPVVAADLIVTPVAYSIFDDFGAWVTRRKQTAAVPAAPLGASP
jgi:hypothetical protein